MSNNKFLLLINSSLRDVNFIINSLAVNTSYILYNDTDTYTTILNKVQQCNKSFNSIGFMSVNDGSNILSMSDKTPIIKSIYKRDKKMKSWSKCITFLNGLVNFTRTRNIDLVTCNIFNNNDWKYIINYLKDNYNITIQSSTNITGKSGDWILESNNLSLDTTYFTSIIKNYSYNLDKTYESSFAINNNGKLYVTGLNDDGQLGMPTNTYLNQFELLDLSLNQGETISKVSSGNSHTVILTSDGRIFTAGYNDSGQLGFDSNRLDISTFTLVTIDGLNNGEKPNDIITGYNHTMIITSNKRLFTSGDNQDGQLGLGHNDNIYTFTEVIINISIYDPDTDTTNISQMTDPIEKVVCGEKHTIILTNTNRLFSTGSNYNGQLGLENYGDMNTFTEVIINISTYDPDTDTTITNQMTDPITQIACGDNYSFILTTTNKLFATGYNYYGQLGLGYDYNDNDIYSFTRVENIEVFDADTQQNIVIQLNETISKIICGESYTLFLTSSNKLFCTGYNDDGQLGLNDKNSRNYFTDISISSFLNNGETIINLDAGNSHTLLVTSIGRVFGTGNNGDNQLGLETNGNGILQFTEVPINGLILNEMIQNVSCGDYHTIILTNNNRLFRCGSNYNGQLGKQVLENVFGFIEANIPLQQGETVHEVSSGSYHTLVLTNNNRLFGTGRNWDGQLGLGNANTNTYFEFTLIPTETFLANGETISKLSCGEQHSMLLTSNNRLFGTGYCSDGEIGLGNNNTIYEFTNVSINGLNPGEIVTKLSCGDYYTLISTNLNRVLSTGQGWGGQLGNGNDIDIYEFTDVSLVLNSGETISQIIGGPYHSFILTSNNRILASGGNSSGELGNGYNVRLYSFTDISLETLITLNNGETVKEISAGNGFTSILTTANRIFSSGDNRRGQLGNGNNYYVNTFTDILLSSLGVLNNGETITQIICGYEHTLFLTSNNRIFGTGANYQGQLGMSENYLINNSTNYFINVPTSSPFIPVSFTNYTAPISNICFPAGTPIQTDQGIISIEKINTNIHTIRKNKILVVTKTITQDNDIVCIEKNALGKNIPSEKTFISRNHKLFYNGKMITAIELLDKLNNYETIYKVNYSGEILYNILLDKHDTMIVNNLICETLNPINDIAKLYLDMDKRNYTYDKKQQIINNYNNYVKRNNLFIPKK
jgi:alpha-tubulin suppressor-like RCC1 family protein